MASPAYLTATPGNASNGSFVNTPEIEVTALFGQPTSFYVVRHSAYNSLTSTSYRITLETSTGNVTIPQLSDLATSLTLNGRDSKIHVADYDLGGINLVYSSGEIFTWNKYSTGIVLVLYGGANETHEFAVSASLGTPTVQGGNVAVYNNGQDVIVQWQVIPDRRIVSFPGGLTVHLLWRNEAYNYWVLDLPAPAPISNYTSMNKTKVIINGPYLLRTAEVSGGGLYLTGDLNATTTVEVIGKLPEQCSSLYFNGKKAEIIDSSNVSVAASVQYVEPQLTVPTLSSLTWKYIDSLPEIQPSYDDSAWTVCNLTTTNNPRQLTTPTDLYASDYGYNTGSLIYRGHLTANGSESSFSLEMQGGYAFGYSIWLDQSFIASWRGTDADQNYNGTYLLPTLRAGSDHIITILMDHMGLDENGEAGADEMKDPRGILTFQLGGRDQSAITWKLTGNLGGEQYVDKVRGPLNEGAFYAERQGYHQPAPPSSTWAVGSPLDGFETAGVRFYSTSFNLSIPAGYDVPMSFVFNNGTAVGAPNGTAVQYRSMLFVNGYQFGKYVHNVGPQDSYPVPEGILNYHGENWIGLTLWALEDSGAKLDGFNVSVDAVIQTGRQAVVNSPMPAWSKRAGAY